MEEKEDRLDDLIQMAQAGYTLQEMGDKWGVSRERIRQILDGVGVSTASIREANRLRIAALPITCPLCGKEYMRTDWREHFKAGTHRYLYGAARRTSEEIERDQGIVADHKAGMLIKDICTKYHCSPGRIKRAYAWEHEPQPRRKRSGTVLKTRAASQIRMMAMARDYQAKKLHPSEIVAKYGVSIGMLKAALRFAGVPVRSLSEAQQVRAEINLARGLSKSGKQR